jgi:hypothetical protein
MANEFKIKKGLIVTGASGGTVVDIQGSQGQLFSVTDDLSGSIFAVSDISGVPILDVNSNGTIQFSDLSAGTLVSDASGNITVSSGGGAGGPYLPLAGGTMTGNLFIEGASTPKITITDTTNNLEGRIRVANNYMYIEADNSDAVVSTRMVLKTDGVEALYLDGNQNATFAGAVAVNGTNVTVANASNPYIYINDTNAGAGIFQQEGNTTRIGSDSNTQVVLVQNNATAVTIDTSKNVGIGTTNPNTKLRIVETSSTTPPLSIQNSNADGYSGSWFYDSAGTIVGHLGWANGTTTALSNKMYFGTIANKDVVFTTNDTERVRITSTGNVGIGTTSPTEKLVIDGKVIINNTTPPNNLAQLNIGSTSGGETRAIDIDGNWTAGESKSITFAYGTDATHMVGQINCVFNTSTDSRLRWGKLYHGGVSSTYTMELKSTSTTTANLTVAGSIQMADDTDTASADKVGTMRYRTGTEYVEVDGVELVTNGDFATDTDWTKGANTTISGGTLNSTAIGVYVIANQGGVVSQSLYYKWTVTYTITSGGIRLGDSSNVWAGSDQTASGTYTGFVQAASTADGNLYMTSPSSNFIGSVDNVSVIEVTEEDASYADMCMQTGSSTYEWVNIVRNTY